MRNLKLKAARVAKGLTLEQLATLCGYSRQTVGGIERGTVKASLNCCIAICKALDKTLDELFWEDKKE